MAHKDSGKAPNFFKIPAIEPPFKKAGGSGPQKREPFWSTGFKTNHDQPETCMNIRWIPVTLRFSSLLLLPLSSLFQLNCVNESHTALPEMIRIRKSYFDHIMSKPTSRVSMWVILGDVNGHSWQGNAVETLNTCSHVNTILSNLTFEITWMFWHVLTIQHSWERSQHTWLNPLPSCRCPQIRDLPHIPEQCSGACPCGWSECTSRCSCASSDFDRFAALLARAPVSELWRKRLRSPSGGERWFLSLS